MAKFKYTAVETDASWTEHLYHGDVAVVNGFAETDDPLFMEGLLYRGFVQIEEAGAPTEVDQEALESESEQEEEISEPAEPKPRRNRRRS